MNKTETHVVDIEEHDYDYGSSVIGTAYFESQSLAFEYINDHNNQFDQIDGDLSYYTVARYKGVYYA